MMTTGNEGFARAVEVALNTLGTGLLCRPQEFVGAVTDLYDPDSPEATVLYAHASDELLRPFAEAARAGTTDALEQAAKRAELWLRDVRRVNADDANVVAWGIARGIAAHLGVGWSRNTNDGPSREDEATRSAIERARAVLANSGATEEDVAGALAAVRALPTGTQGKAGLESTLEGRLAKLVAEREADETRKAEEERLRREAEERARAEAARKRREERDRLLAEREARRKAAENERPAPNPESGPKPNNRGVAAVIAVIACVIVAIVLVSNSKSNDLAKDASSQGSTITETKVQASEGSVTGVPVRDGIGEYPWAELKAISNAIADAKNDKAGIKIAKEYHLVDSDGRLQGDTKAVTLTDGTKTSVRILGFRHDELAGGGRAGISFEFADALKKHCMNAEDTNEGGWEGSEMRAWLNSDFWELLPKDVRSCVEPASKRTNNIGGDVGNVFKHGFYSTSGDKSIVTTTSDNLWLLSSVEVEGVKEDSEVQNAEGKQYQIYDTHNGGLEVSGVFEEQRKTGAKHWWSRSPYWNASEISKISSTNKEEETEYPSELPRVRFDSFVGDVQRLANTGLEIHVDCTQEFNLPSQNNGVSPGFCF